MKKFTLPVFALLLFSNFSWAQKTNSSSVKTGAIRIRKCATMDKVDQFFRLHPEQKTIAALKSAQQPTGKKIDNYRLASIVTVPVIIHIVLPNPYLITDADVQIQIAKLNQDYAGVNADSTNAPAEFLAVRGHSRIQFCAAKRTPSGQLANGIERRASFAGSDAGASPDPIKHASQGGLDQWDPNSYLNVWVGVDGSGNGILGYALFPGTTPADEDGVFINYQSFSTNSCYALAQFNLGRTLVHEIGHYFGLFHIWGDENACSGDDFRDITNAGSSFSLPAGLYNPAGSGNTASDIGDTPNQASATTTCLSGIVTDSCSSSSPGKMYQDYMDYTDDACYSMFTKKQVERMEWVLDNFRPGLKTSLGCQPPASAVLLDAAPLESVNPGGYEISGCNQTTYYTSNLSCAGSIIPKFRVVNNGLSSITSLTAGYRLDNGTAVTQTVSLNLQSKGTAVVTLPAVFLSAGAHQLKFFTSNPNSSADQTPGNDTLVKSIVVATITTLPLTENFESTTFPPGQWTVNNFDADSTWRRTTPGNASAGAMFINNYSVNQTDHIDDFVSQPVNISGAPVVKISFDVAHKYYGSSGTYWDTLSVLVSNDCGATYQNVYKKWGPNLATAGISGDTSYINPAAGDWRTDSIYLSGAILSSGQIIVAFRNTSRFGNNIFIDNINIAQVPGRNLQMVSIDAPNPILCSGAITPSITIKNVGGETITSANISYSIDNDAPQTITSSLNLASNTQTNISLPATTVSAGVHTIKVYSWQPVSASGTGDVNKLNDTLSKQFAIAGNVNAPLTENFAATNFPPSNWVVVNPDANISWGRNANGNGNTGSAFINTFNYNGSGQTDDLASPNISYSGVDSVKLSFDYAASPFRYALGTGSMDTLEVLITRDCGNTFTTVYKKWGASLTTLLAPQSSEFFPQTSGQWKNETIDLTRFATQSPIMIMFRSINNKENNIFIDNVNLTTRTLPAQLKQQGYLVLPTAFQNNFTVWHYLAPTNLKYITVYNSVGQLTWSKQYSGNADRYIQINMSGQASGVYIVQLGYSDGKATVIQRVIKY